jgi:hypothetical protein
LEIEPFVGSFALRASSDFLTVPRGGTGVFGFDVLRDQFDGPVHLTASSIPTGAYASAGSVEGLGTTRAVVTVTAPADFTEVTGWFVITGRAQLGDREFCRSADLSSLCDAPAGLRPNQGHFFFLRPLPAVLTHRIALVVAEPAPFALDLPEKRVMVGIGGSTMVPVVCRRLGGFSGPVRLRVEGLPAKIVVEAPPLNDGADHANIQLKVASDAPPGQFLLAVVGEATTDGRTQSNATPPITLEVK